MTPEDYKREDNSPSDDPKARSSKRGDENFEDTKQPANPHSLPVYTPHLLRDEDEIDLAGLLLNLWKGRRSIAKITGLFLIIGIFIALFSPVEYESEAILMPEIRETDQSRAGQLLQQYGGMLGMGSISELQEGMIPPQIYPRIVNSYSFQLALLSTPVHFEKYGVTATLPGFYEDHYQPSLTEWIRDLTIGLPGKLAGIFAGNPSGNIVVQEDPLNTDYITVTRGQQQMVEKLRARISVRQDLETGLLTSKVKLNDSRAAAELNRRLIEMLKEYVTEYRLERSRLTLEFVQNQVEEARETFEEAQLKLADFRDRNVSLATARAQTELERLQDEKNLAFNVYNSLSQRLEEVRLKLHEQTPIFKEVQAVTVPQTKSEPRRGLIIIFSIFSGIVFSLGYLFLSPVIQNIKKRDNP